MRYLLALVLCVMLPGCRDNTAEVVLGSLDKEVSIGYGQEAYIPNQNLRIIFTDVTEDSRCPDNARCIWAGNGKVVVKLITPGTTAIDASLNTYLDPKEVSYESFSIQLRELSPYPHAGSQIEKNSYKIILVVHKD